MINILKTKISSVRILALFMFIWSVTVPVRSLVLAENEVRYFSSDTATYTADFGVDNPEGMAYFSGTNSFVVWGMNKSERMISLRTETSKKTNFTELMTNPLAASFDNRSNNFFSLDAGNKELQKIKVDSKNAQPLLNESAHFKIESLNLSNIDGMTVDPATGQLFVLDAGTKQLLALSPDSASGSTYQDAANYLSLAALSKSSLRGVAFNPTNSHLYIGDSTARKVYEVTKTGDLVSTYDISYLDLKAPSAMLFAPSQDATDDPNIMALYILDSGQAVQSGSTIEADQRNTSERGQIVELSLQAPAALPPGTTLLPATLVRTFDTSNQAWNPSSPDPAGIDYWPAANRLVISDSEVEEMRPYWQGSNVFLSTTSGNLTGTCSTMAYTGEPTGVAVNPNNNHIFIAADYLDLLFEISLGPDGQYCTSDDVVTETSLVTAYGVTDAEDVAYGNNTVFIGGGDDAEVFVIPLGANGVVGGGDDGPMTHWDTNSLGFADTEGIGFNHDAGTLFVVSTKRTDRYLGEFSTSGTLLKAYNLSFMPDEGNIRSDVTYAPGSQNASVKSIYIASRGIDNDSNRTENDGKVWEVAISNAVVPTATTVIVPTATNVVVPTPTVVTSGSAQVVVNIGGSNIQNYSIPSGQRISDDYNINSGPVRVTSTNGRSFFTSLRAIFGNSFNSIVGYPANQLTTEYWFTSYDDVGMTTFLVIGNPHPTTTAEVDVYIGGTLRGQYSIAPGQRVFPRYGINSGPVRVVSTNGINIFTSERTRFGNSFNEVMGYPANRFSTEYWFTSYDDAGMTTFVVIGNPHTLLTAEVDVFIGGNLMGHYSIAPGQRVFPRYGINSGPVRVVSTNGVNIFTSERTRFGDTFNEVMGYPANQAHTEFWFTSYDDTSMLTYVIVGNPSLSQMAEVDIYIGGVKKNTTPIQIAPGQRYFQRYGINSGPVRVVSTNGVNVFASERSKYLQSFNEILGIANNQLTTDYWFTSYDDVGMTTFLVIGNP